MFIDQLSSNVALNSIKTSTRVDIQFRIIKLKLIEQRARFQLIFKTIQSSSRLIRMTMIFIVALNEIVNQLIALKFAQHCEWRCFSGNKISDRYCLQILLIHQIAHNLGGYQRKGKHMVKGRKHSEAKQSSKCHSLKHRIELTLALWFKLDSCVFCSCARPTVIVSSCLFVAFPLRAQGGECWLWFAIRLEHSWWASLCATSFQL